MEDIKIGDVCWCVYHSVYGNPNEPVNEPQPLPFQVTKIENGKYFEKSDGKILDDSEKDAKIIATENINNEIEKITTDEKKICFSGEVCATTDFYKYKKSVLSCVLDKISKFKQEYDFL